MDTELVLILVDARWSIYVRAGENKHVPVREASEVIQIGPLVLAKNGKLDMDYTGYNEGGTAMKEQMELALGEGPE